MKSRRFFVGLVVLASFMGLAACGGGNPAGPDEARGVTLSGNVVGGSFGSASASSGTSSAATLTVSVVGTSLTATVSADGTFTLRGLPEGNFVLEFFLDGVSIGTIPFDAVKPNQEITITVAITASSVALLEQRRNGIGHGDVEIEGRVDSAMPNPTGDSIFMIKGYTVVARPLQTAIREGNRARTVNDVTVGRKVHVKGVWETATSGQQVLAHEIKLQGPADDGDDDGGGDTPPGSFCPAAGKKAEVEGKIKAKGASDITVFQNGKGDFLALVSNSTRIRKGNTNYTFDQLAVGNRVHVKGTSQGLTGAVCTVQASEVKLQN